MIRLVKAVNFFLLRYFLVFLVLIVFGVIWVWINWLLRFNDQVILPNGFILKRQFDLEIGERDDMFASDGQMLIARGIDFICFDDRYTALSALDIFDGNTNDLVPIKEVSGRYDTGVMSGPHSCNGYYTGWIGAGMLYPNIKQHLMSPCEWRNVNNSALGNREWLNKLCN